MQFETQAQKFYFDGLLRLLTAEYPNAAAEGRLLIDGVDATVRLVVSKPETGRANPTAVVFTVDAMGDEGADIIIDIPLIYDAKPTKSALLYMLEWNFLHWSFGKFTLFEEDEDDTSQIAIRYRVPAQISTQKLLRETIWIGATHMVDLLSTLIPLTGGDAIIDL